MSTDKKRPPGCQQRRAAEERAAALRAAGLTPEQIRLVAAQRIPKAEAAELAAGAAPPPGAAVDLGVPPPPLNNSIDGIAAVESWAARVAAVACTRLPELGDDQIKALRKAVQAVGKLKDKGLRSAKAVVLLRLRDASAVDAVRADPPAEEVALPAWAFFRSATALHQVAQGNLLAAGDGLDLLCSIGFVPSNLAIREITRRLRGKG